MPLIKYKVTLDRQEREMLQEIATRGKHSSQKVLNTLILLSCDQGPFQDRRLTNQQIAEALPVSMKKIDRVKRRFVEIGLDAALDKQKAKRTYVRKADGDVEAHLIALSLRPAAARPRPLVAAVAGRPDGRTGVRRRHFP